MCMLRVGVVDSIKPVRELHERDKVLAEENKKLHTVSGMCVCVCVCEHVHVCMLSEDVVDLTKPDSELRERDEALAEENKKLHTVSGVCILCVYACVY